MAKAREVGCVFESIHAIVVIRAFKLQINPLVRYFPFLLQAAYVHLHT